MKALKQVDFPFIGNLEHETTPSLVLSVYLLWFKCCHSAPIWKDTAATDGRLKSMLGLSAMFICLPDLLVFPWT